MDCKVDPRAPHGFLRNASHSADRYVCECEFWEPPMNDSVNAYLAQFLHDKIVEHDSVPFEPPTPTAEMIFKWLQEFEESQV